VSPVIDRVELSEFVRRVLVPREAEVERTDAIPADLRQQMSSVGLFGWSVPATYGGAEVAIGTEVELIMELGWAAAAFRSLVGINLGVGSQGIVRFGTREQKARWLPGIASGATITSFALTEPEAGSDATSVTTTAAATATGYVLNGSKRFVTNAPLAGVMTLIARTNPEKLPGNRQLSAFLVSMDSPGVTVGPRRELMGQRGGYWADVELRNVAVDRRDLLGAEGEGFTVMLSLLDRSRLQVSAFSVGQGRRLLHESLAHSSTRHQFAQALSDFELVQAMIADTYAELCAMESMVRDAAARLAAGESVSARIAATKLFVTEALGRIADRTVQIFGAAGVERGGVAERTYRDVRALRFIEGTTQMQQITIARSLVKEHTLNQQKEH
jgi:acyl-CoA dehydrogenase